ncbi:hypothetical protein DFQ26_005682, partial [Actinomortierella ambigua]
QPILLIGESGAGIGSRIGGHTRLDGGKMRTEHVRYCTIGMTEESIVSNAQSAAATAATAAATTAAATAGLFETDDVIKKEVPDEQVALTLSTTATTAMWISASTKPNQKYFHDTPASAAGPRDDLEQEENVSSAGSSGRPQPAQLSEFDSLIAEASTTMQLFLDRIERLHHSILSMRESSAAGPRDDLEQAENVSSGSSSGRPQPAQLSEFDSLIAEALTTLQLFLDRIKRLHHSTLGTREASVVPLIEKDSEAMVPHNNKPDDSSMNTADDIATSDKVANADHSY